MNREQLQIKGEWRRQREAMDKRLRELHDDDMQAMVSLREIVGDLSVDDVLSLCERNEREQRKLYRDRYQWKCIYRRRMLDYDFSGKASRHSP